MNKYGNPADAPLTDLNIADSSTGAGSSDKGGSWARGALLGTSNPVT